MLAEFALERFPAVGLDALTLLFGPLGVEPLPEALKMNVTHGTRAFARRDERVLLLVFLAEADAADFLLLGQLGLLHENQLLSMRLLLLQRLFLPFL